MKLPHKILNRHEVYVMNPHEKDHSNGIITQDMNAMNKTANVIHIDANVMALGLV